MILMKRELSFGQMEVILLMLIGMEENLIMQEMKMQLNILETMEDGTTFQKVMVDSLLLNLVEQFLQKM